MYGIDQDEYLRDFHNLGEWERGSERKTRPMGKGENG
jgi:hypothetical protein